MVSGRHPARLPAAPRPSHTSVPFRAAHTDGRDATLGEVACDTCAATVLVAKFSPQHTSVQWSREATAACTEFSARVATGEQIALIDTCASLRDSIDRAVAEGRLEVTPP